MELLTDNAEWMRCLQDPFASTFELPTTVFATLNALCEPSSTVVLLERNVANMLTDLRRRYAAVPKASTLLQSEEEMQKYAVQELQYALKDINDRLNVEDFGMREPDNIRALPHLNADPESTKEQQKEVLELAVQSFNDVQKAVLNAVVREILAGVTADHPFAPVTESKGFTRRKPSLNGIVLHIPPSICQFHVILRASTAYPWTRNWQLRFRKLI